MKTNIILQGDALQQLKGLPEKSINMCMTSPPYWALRDYGVEGQLGLEPTFEEYINDLCNIFDEVKRVLRDDGTCWVNLGDTYSGSGNGSNDYRNTKTKNYRKGEILYKGQKSGKTSVSNKSLLMIPFRFVIEMVNRGWILRNTIIWHKRNCMPSSIKDRFTVDFEYLFFFSKKPKYYFETQYEPSNYDGRKDTVMKGSPKYDVPTGWDTKNRSHTKLEGRYAGNQQNRKHERWKKDDKGNFVRQKRCVWDIKTKGLKEAHFAVYPEELCENPIKAGCPEFVCVKCGNPKIKIYEKIEKEYKKREDCATKQYAKSHHNDLIEKKDLGYKPTCLCNTDFTGGIVLDPFFGAGTTGLVALKQNKKFIGIELNKEYIEIANKRLKPHLEQTKL